MSAISDNEIKEKLCLIWLRKNAVPNAADGHKKKLRLI